MGKMLVAVFFGLIVMAGASAAFAHQSGGVEVGDLETGSVAGIAFKELDVDAELFALELGASQKKVWYPPTTVVDFKVRPGRPFLLKVKLVLKPGETKYLGIPTSDLFYATSGNVLYYSCHLHPAHVGGRLLMIK